MFKMVVELMVKHTVLHWIKWNPAPDLFFSDDGKFLKLKASPFMQDTWAPNACVVPLFMQLVWLGFCQSKVVTLEL